MAEAKRVVAIQQRLHAIQWVVFGGVILLTVGAGAQSWEHLTHIAATNGHIAARHLLSGCRRWPTFVTRRNAARCAAANLCSRSGRRRRSCWPSAARKRCWRSRMPTAAILASAR